MGTSPTFRAWSYPCNARPRTFFTTELCVFLIMAALLVPAPTPRVPPFVPRTIAEGRKMGLIGLRDFL